MKPSQALIGVVGDRNPSYALHIATDRALSDGAKAEVDWLPTDTIARADLSRYAGFLVAPGSPYQDMDGALTAIRYARERQVPLLGTCGGFQHLVIEFARNVAGIAAADHEESSPGAASLAITFLTCAVVGQTRPVHLVPGTRVAAIYGAAETAEPFFCRYGLNPAFRSIVESHGLVAGGLDENGEVRTVELPSHPFFIGTLFVPQARHEPGRQHPLIAAFVAAANRRQTLQHSGRAA